MSACPLFLCRFAPCGGDGGGGRRRGPITVEPARCVKHELRPREPPCAHCATRSLWCVGRLATSGNGGESLTELPSADGNPWRGDRGRSVRQSRWTRGTVCSSVGRGAGPRGRECRPLDRGWSVTRDKAGCAGRSSRSRPRARDSLGRERLWQGAAADLDRQSEHHRPTEAPACPWRLARSMDRARTSTERASTLDRAGAVPPRDGAKYWT
jgi:hypothetical protein